MILMSSNFVVGFYPAGNYMFKVNNRNTRTRREICSTLAIMGVFIVNFEHISYLVLVFLLLTLSRLMLLGLIINTTKALDEK